PGNIVLGLLIYFIAALVIPDAPSNGRKGSHHSEDDSVIEGEFKEK
ncbi:PspC domain-containing protein, partial [Campylobacter jejuni]|nr:PspC domain-containing protein [Campylobacter jejuni]